jgi:hypothetical protein
MNLLSKGLNIGHLNVQGLTSKLDEIKLLLQNNNNIHIFGISETKLQSDHITEFYHVEGFQTPYRRDRLINRGGGLLVYIKEDVPCQRRADLENNDIESIWLELKPKNSKSILICHTYRPPDSPVAWKDHFEAQFEKAQNEEKEIIILGDINRDLLNEQIKFSWSNYLTSLGLSQIIKEPTRVCEYSKTLIDHIYVTNQENILDTRVLNIGISDHFPIFCNRKINFSIPKKQHICIRYRSHKNFNEINFKNDLNKIQWSEILQIRDVNVALGMFERFFSEVLDKHLPLRTHRVKTLNQPDWITSEILDTIKERDKSKARNDNQNYRLLRNRVIDLINISKKSSYENKIEKGQNNPSSIWKIFKEFRSSNSSNEINEIIVNNQEITDKDLIADEFNSFFTNVAANLKDEIAPSNFDLLNNYVSNKVPVPMFFNIPLITRDKVTNMISELDSSKATGLDGIGPKIVKLSADVISPTIQHIMNLSFNSGVFPDSWKAAKVNPIFKSGSPQDINNYRPISILPTLSKLIERHVHNHFSNYLDHYKLIVESQSGFRKNHSCETALVSLIDRWIKAIHDGKIVGVVMVDFRKAFDLVDHNILLNKLKLYKCSNQTLNWFKSYLLDRKQSVLIHEAKSKHSTVESGVPQGSILGPLLFLLFINDLSLTLRNTITNTDMYADDTTICDIHESKEVIEKNLQSALVLLSEWCAQNGMVLNTSKTKVLLITTPHKRGKNENYNLNLKYKDIPLELTTGDKILGVNINQNLKWDNHINVVKKKISSNLWLLSKIKPFVSLDHRIVFYKAYIQPHIDYCNIIWGGTSKQNIQSILLLQKRACKIILGYQYTNFQEAMKSINALSIHHRILLQKAKFMYKVNKGLVPEYILSMFEHRTTGENLRNVCDLDYNIPRPKMELFKTSMSYSGPMIWNKIPASIRNSNSIQNFSKKFILWLKNS